MTLIPIGEDAKNILAGEFSEPVTIVFFDDPEEVTIDTTGIYDETYMEIDPETGAIVQSKNPRVTVFAREIEDAIGREISDDIEEDWLVKARGKDFRIKSVQKDGTGVAHLPLKNA